MTSPTNPPESNEPTTPPPKPIHPDGTPRPDSPTLGNPPQYHATKPEITSTTPRPVVTNDPRPRPKPEIINAPSLGAFCDIFGPGGKGVEVSQGFNVLDCGDVEEKHMMLFQERGHGKKGDPQTPPPRPGPLPPRPATVKVQGLFLGAKDDPRTPSPGPTPGPLPPPPNTVKVQGWFLEAEDEKLGFGM